MSGAVTARTFLFGAGGSHATSGVLGGSLREHEVARSVLTSLTRASRVAFQAIDDEIARVVDGLLDLDLGKLLAAGWRKHAALIEAANRSLAVPGMEEIVILATHCVTSTHHPHVDILVDGSKAASIVFDLTVTFEVDCLVAVVRDGGLVRLRAGDCSVKAKLALEEVELAEGCTRFDLAVAASLPAPIPLVDGAGTSSPGDRHDAML